MIKGKIGRRNQKPQNLGTIPKQLSRKITGRQKQGTAN